MLGWIVKRQSSEHIDKNFPESQAAAIFVQLLPENLELSLFMNFFKPRRWLLAFLCLITYFFVYTAMTLKKIQPQILTIEFKK